MLSFRKLCIACFWRKHYWSKLILWYSEVHQLRYKSAKHHDLHCRRQRTHHRHFRSLQDHCPPRVQNFTKAYCIFAIWFNSKSCSAINFNSTICQFGFKSKSWQWIFLYDHHYDISKFITLLNGSLHHCCESYHHPRFHSLGISSLYRALASGNKFKQQYMTNTFKIQ